MLPPWLRYLLGGVIVAASLYFLAARLVQDWQEIPFEDLQFRPLLLVASFALLILLHYPLYTWAWKLLLSGLGEKIPFWRALAILSVTQLGKYIPGKVWFTVGRVSLAGREGVPVAKSLVSVVIETGFTFLAAVLLFGVAVLILPGSTLPLAAYLLFLAVPLCLVVVYPPVLNRLLGVVLRRTGRPVFRLELSYPRLLGILLIYVANWVAQGLGAFLLISSYTALPLSAFPALTAGYAVSWMIGFLVLPVPAGIGVRETAYTFSLDHLAALGPLATGSALITRVWVTLFEAAMALAFAPFFARKKKRYEEEIPTRGR